MSISHIEGTVLKTLVITDLVASTHMTLGLGDARAAEIFAQQDRLARDLLAKYGGAEIDKTDGFLLFFDRPIEAVHFSLAYHEALDGLSTEVGIQVETRVGIHLGEVVIRKNSPEDVHRGANAVEVEGLAKPFTARLMSLCLGKQILLSHTAFEMARRAAVGMDSPRGELRWLAHGGYILKGVEEPVEVFEVGIEGFAPLAPPSDTEKARRVGDSETVLGWRPAADQEIPRRPRWFIQKKLGEGGFGEVWLARHSKTGEQRVFKFCYETERLRALQREVTLFRLLKEDLGDRPDINRILDWNFDEAPYFLESEYTESGSLLEWAEQQNGLENVPIETRLDIVAQIAEALAAAHSVGVLHKDVKPGNILIRSDQGKGPRVSLTDFGIGLVTDKERLSGANITVLGMTAMAGPEDTSSGTGTWLYMAPELLEARPATVQADIYALGVIFYQMVVGDLGRALAPGWGRNVEDEVLQEDIRAAVDGSPRRRTQNAQEIAEGIRNLEKRRQQREETRLAGEREERNQKRRKAAWIVASASIVLLAIMSVFSFMVYRAQQQAEENLQLAKAAVDQMLTEVGSEALADIPQMEDVRRILLSKARNFYLEFQKKEPSDPDMRMEPALAQRRLADISRLENDLDAADEGYARSIEILEQLVAQHPERAEYGEELAHTYNWRGELLRDHPEHWPVAMESYDRALEVQQRLSREWPELRRFSMHLARTHNNRGNLLQSTGELWEAQSSYREAIEILKSLEQAGGESLVDSSGEVLLELSRCYNNLGGLLDAEGKVVEAKESFELAVRTLEILVERSPNKRQFRTELAMVAKNMAIFLYRGEYDRESLQWSHRATELFAELARPIPAISGEFAHTFWLKGRILEEQGLARQSREAFEESILLSRQLKADLSDYSKSNTFHNRFAWLRWIEAPVSLDSLTRLPSEEREAVCQDYSWLVTELTNQEISGVLREEDYQAVSDVLASCAQVASRTSGPRGGRPDYQKAIEALQIKFNSRDSATGR